MYNLSDLFEAVSPSQLKHGFIPRLMSAGFCLEEIEREVERHDWDIKKEDLHDMFTKNRVKELEFIQEINKEWADNRRLEYVKAKYNECLSARNKMIKVGTPLWFVNVIMDILQASKWSKLKKLLSKKDNRGNEITDQMIEQAKDYPITELVEVNQAGFALCVDHSDTRPSMYCKNNYAYCFSCGYKADVISLYMKINNLTFIEAIRRLVR